MDRKDGRSQGVEPEWQFGQSHLAMMTSAASADDVKRTPSLEYTSPGGEEKVTIVWMVSCNKHHRLLISVLPSMKTSACLTERQDLHLGLAKHQDLHLGLAKHQDPQLGLAKHQDPHLGLVKFEGNSVLPQHQNQTNPWRRWTVRMDSSNGSSEKRKKLCAKETEHTPAVQLSVTTEHRFLRHMVQGRASC